MYPEILKIGPFTLHSFGLMLAISFLVASFIVRSELQRKGQSPILTNDILLAAIIGGVIGAKVYYLIEQWHDFVQHPLSMFLSGSGLVWYGGLILGAVAVIFVLVIRRVSVAITADVGAPALAIGYAFGRMGCFLNGDDYGRPTTLPWGMSFPNGAPPTTNLVHPTQIYEILLSLGIFAVLWSIRKQKRPDGFFFWLYLVLAGMERFIIEFWRTTRVVGLGLTTAQIISIIMIFVGVTEIMLHRSGQRRTIT